MMNETLKVIETRYSCRSYADKPVEQKKIEAIAKAALEAPSALNIQPWHLIAMTDKKLIDELDTHVMSNLKKREDQTAYKRMMERGGKPYYHAPVMFLILKKTGASQWGDIDCGIVAQNIALAATSLGLGSVIAAMCATAFVEGDRIEEFKAKFNWPDGYEFGMGVLVGYPEVAKAPHEIDKAKLTIIS